MVPTEIINSNEFQAILEELHCDWSSTKTLWLQKVKGCHSRVGRFVPRELKRELETRNRDEIIMEVAEHLYYNKMENE